MNKDVLFRFGSLNKNAAGATCGRGKLTRGFLRTGAIQGSPEKIKPRTPMMSGDLPALKA
jgi:hypothetical protein